MFEYNIALNKYIQILDTRLSKLADVEQGTGNVAKKVRVLGEPSKSSPPHDAPGWAVKKEYSRVNSEQGSLICMPTSSVVYCVNLY